MHCARLDKNESADAYRPATIYAFDVTLGTSMISLRNRRLFAFVLKGVPLQIQVDTKGRVYAACGDGLEVWRSDGTILGVIEVPGLLKKSWPCA